MSNIVWERTSIGGVMVIFSLVTHELLWYLHVYVCTVHRDINRHSDEGARHGYICLQIPQFPRSHHFSISHSDKSTTISKPFHNNGLPHDHEITSRVFPGSGGHLCRGIHCCFSEQATTTTTTSIFDLVEFFFCPLIFLVWQP